ncbi:E3 ubiquitin-protein ligase MARCHF3 isoform X2 [Pleurodeles waltl]|uniref:E3 ubiquitin-protein ligase MARCHF3 isoform X2 n=1 Tax=Pleurodeles waltl TaxID=8319 RepID=UPI003709731A
MTTSRCSHLPEVPPDCPAAAGKSLEDCGGLAPGQPQYVMQVSAKDGQLLSSVVRTLANQSPFNDRPICRICHESSTQEDLLSPCECTGTLGAIHRSCLEHWLSSSNTSYCELCHFRFAVERKPRPLTETLKNRKNDLLKVNKLQFLLKTINWATVRNPISIQISQMSFFKPYVKPCSVSEQDHPLVLGGLEIKIYIFANR